MSFDPGYEFGSEMAGFLIIYLFVILLAMGWSIISYIFSSLGLYTIAKRRELNHPWMAWVPVLSLWTLGSVSDQYQYVTQGKNKNKRKWLIGLYIAYFVVFIIFYIGFIVFAVIASSSVDAAESEMVGAAVGFVIAFIVGWLVLMGTIIAMAVIRYIALYDLYKSCNPGNATLFLVLSILVSVTEPFLVFACRKKDLGMPPRQPRSNGYFPEQPGYQQEPMHQPQGTAYQSQQPPVYQAPVYQPSVYQPEPAAEPETPRPEQRWDNL